jgi:hypothetical protein
MSYSKAKKCFQENVTVLGDGPMNTPEKILIWNLSVGLSALTQALEEDLAEMREVLDAVPQRAITRVARDQ